MELRSSKTTELTPGRFALDAATCPIQMRGGGEQWADITPALVRVGNLRVSQGTPYRVEINSAGQRTIYPDRQDLSKYIRLPAIGLFSGLSKNWEPSRLRMSTTNYDILFGMENSRVTFKVVMRQAPPFSQINLNVDSVGYDIAKMLTATEGVGIPKPILVDSSKPIHKVRPLDWSFNAGQLILGFDLTGLTFPVTLHNTTVDLQVTTTTANDGADIPAIAAFDATSCVIGEVGGGGFSSHSFFRWTGCTISGTIDVAYIQLYGDATNSASTLMKVRGVDEDNPAAPTSDATFNADPLTAAGVDWDAAIPGAFTNSPSLVSIFTELVGSYTISGDAVMLQVIDDGSPALAYNAINDYSTSTTNAAKLHIEYTAAGGLSVPISTYYMLRGIR